MDLGRRDMGITDEKYRGGKRGDAAAYEVGIGRLGVGSMNASPGTRVGSMRHDKGRKR